MNIFFAGLSAAYIFGIFFWADSEMVNQISTFNPMSLLHIPLYGILTILLILTFQTPKNHNSKWKYFLGAAIAMGVAIFDEYHQSFIPQREASFGDILLDGAGIFLALIFFKRAFSFFGPGLLKRKVGTDHLL